MSEQVPLVETEESQNAPKKRRGRPKKITPRVEKQLLELLSAGNSMSYVCSVLGISRMTEWDFRQKNAEYRLRLDEVLSRRVEIVEDALYTKAVAGDVQAAKFWLTNRASGKWKNEASIKVGGEEGGQPVRIGVREIIVEIPSAALQEEEAEVKEEPPAGEP